MRPIGFIIALLLARSALAVVRIGNSATGVIETVPPAVAGALAQNWRTVDVAFSEPMLSTGVLTAANYVVAGSGQGTLAGRPDSIALVGDNVYRLAWASGEMAAGDTLTVTVSTVQDSAGNLIGAPNSAALVGADVPTSVAAGHSAAGLLDTVPPTVSSATAQTSKSISVAFSKPMLAPGVATSLAYTISGAGVGILAAHPTAVSGTGPYLLTWTVGEMRDGAPLSVAVSAVQDSLGNLLGTPSTGATTGIGTIPTGIVFINGGSVYTNNRTVTLTIIPDDGAGSGVSLMRFTSEAQYPAGWSGWEAFTGSKLWDSSAYWTGNGPHTVYVQLRDAAGNVSTSVISDDIILDTAPPTASITLSGSTATSQDVLTFNMAFSEPLSAPLSAGRVSLASGSLAGNIAVTGTDPNYTVTVTLSDPNADGSAGILISAAGITDRAGNPYGGGASPVYAVHNWHGLTIQPTDTRLYTHDSHTFSVAGDFGPIAPVFQWKWSDSLSTVHDGSSSASWTISNATPANAGTYWCEVTYDGVLHESAQATLWVADHLRITNPPVGGVKQVGESHTFALIATGGYAPLTYAWEKNGATIPGATQTSYDLPNLTPSDTGSYTVTIIDSNVDIQTASAYLGVGQSVPALGPLSLAALGAILPGLILALRNVKHRHN